MRRLIGRVVELPVALPIWVCCSVLHEIARRTMNFDDLDIDLEEL